jgi:hypothetical protein
MQLAWKGSYCEDGAFYWDNNTVPKTGLSVYLIYSTVSRDFFLSYHISREYYLVIFKSFLCCKLRKNQVKLCFWNAR